MFIIPEELFYVTPKVDRMAIKRSDDAWIEKQKRSEQARFILLHQTRNLFEKTEDDLIPACLGYEDIAVFLERSPWAYLGRNDEKDIFVVDILSNTEQEVIDRIGTKYQFEDLRQAGPLSQRTEAAQMAYGRGLMFWHSRHLFCGRCGSRTESRDAGHVRRCLNIECNLEHFPRTDPAVIMLVHDGERCLLGHHGRLKKGVYSTLAGFVEPGETLEQAVRREVMEEAGVKVGEVTYAGSQPWPFPTSLMLGFYAKAESSDISFEDDELEDAQWFSREDLLNFNDHGRFLPSRDSIARNLIEAWIKAG